MIADATSIFNTAWWYMLFPGLALLLTVLAFNLVGDGLQDALTPKREDSRTLRERTGNEESRMARAAGGACRRQRRGAGGVWLQQQRQQVEQ